MPDDTRIQLRKLFVFDCFCGLAGATLYAWLFDVMIAKLSLPRWMVFTQMFANLAYGLYGAILYLTATPQLGYFRFLMRMNFVYSFLCLVGALAVTWKGAPSVWGACLLVLEGLVIAVLAKVEHTVLKSI